MDGEGPRTGLRTGDHVPRPTLPARRIGLGAAAAVGLAVFCGMCIASASSVTTTTDGVAATSISLPRCSTAGILVFEIVGGTAPGTVGSVYITNMDPSCAGATLTVNVNSGGGTTVSASGTVPAGGGPLTLTISPAPTVVVGNEVDIVIVGP